MKKNGTCITAALLCLFCLTAIVYALPQPDALHAQEVVSKISSINVPFVENRGQIKNSDVSYYARIRGGALFIGQNGEITYDIALNAKTGIVFKEIISKKKNIPTGFSPSPTPISFFKGKDPNAWKAKVRSFEGIDLGEVYSNIKLSLRAYHNNVEKIFTVLPGGKPEAITIALKGVTGLMVNENGELEAISKSGSVRFTAPVAYQIKNGEKKLINVAYAITQGSHYGFRVGHYDTKSPLIIDPLLASTLIGTSQSDFSWAIEVDGNGDVFVSSNTASQEFPTTLGAYDETYNGGISDIYVAKFDNTLSSLLACTYLGGAAQDTTYKMKLDNSGNIFLTGFTDSPDFPVTPGVYSTPSRGNKDVFVALLDSNLSTLIASTVISGSNNDAGYDILLDEGGHVIVTGFTESSDYPFTSGAYDEGFNGGQDIFISKFDSLLTSLVASTFVGGDGTDSATGLTLDGDGNIVITGAASTNFPTTPGAYDRTHNGGVDAFVARLDSTLSVLMASTYIGGSSDGYGYSVKVNDSGEIYMAGETYSSDYPTTPGAYDPTWNGGFMDVMLSKFDSALSNLLASTYLGGSKMDWHHHALLIDGEGNIYVNGLTQSNDFPTTLDADKRMNTYEWDVYISKFNGNLSTLLYSSYFGGNTNGDGSLEMAFDSMNNIYITGWTKCADFPTTPGAYDRSYHGDMDVYVSRLCIYGNSNDVDCDGISQDVDNCLHIGNPAQEDTYPPGGNGCGNACECEGNFDGDNDCDGTDAAVFKVDFGRTIFGRRCASHDPCNGDFECDGDVDGTDAARFKSDFGRSGFNNPCPSCATDPWCVYP